MRWMGRRLNRMGPVACLRVRRAASAERDERQACSEHARRDSCGDPYGLAHTSHFLAETLSRIPSSRRNRDSSARSPGWSSVDRGRGGAPARARRSRLIRARNRGAGRPLEYRIEERRSGLIVNIGRLALIENRTKQTRHRHPCSAPLCERIHHRRDSPPIGRHLGCWSASISVLDAARRFPSTEDGATVSGHRH